MQKEYMEFESRDNKSHISAVKYYPEGEPIGILLIIHGMSEYVERYEDFIKFVCDKGFLVVGEDHLGHGRTVWNNKGSLKGYFTQRDGATVVVRDVHRLKKIIQQDYPGTPIYILGHSMGSYMLRDYLVRYGAGIDGAIIMGTGMIPGGKLAMARALVRVRNFFMNEKTTSRLLNKISFGDYNKRIENPETDFDWLSVNKENVKKYIADDMCGFDFTGNGFKVLFDLVHRSCDRKNMRKIPEFLPILLVSGKEDPVGDYGEGVKKTCDALIEAGCTNTTMVLYDGMRHEILNETDKEKAYRDIADWLLKRIEEDGV
ncbi:MAG: alpha/beta hydrolase [Lachnospiraceae bacterium]|nr:alpha/beta hydrolase [Lachnospiraceae bacterium]